MNDGTIHWLKVILNEIYEKKEDHWQSKVVALEKTITKLTILSGECYRKEDMKKYYPDDED